MIEAKIVEDSISPSGIRLTTFLLTYPRFIHSEFMTHRMFSRNASSSRAIPVKKSIQMVLDNPAIPLAFTKNKAGMQGGEALSGAEHDAAVKTWLEARDAAAKMATDMMNLEIHKQYANRILEPFSHITVVCTATEFSNFFALRYHPMAQPEIAELAKKMWETYSTNTPNPTKIGQWHLPFITPDDIVNVLNDVGNEEGQDPGDEMIAQLIRSSVARCARVSYLNHEGKKPSFSEDNTLYERLVGAAPIHASPAEHQAECTASTDFSGNLRGWAQYRKRLQDENIQTFDGPKE